MSVPLCEATCHVATIAIIPVSSLVSPPPAQYPLRLSLEGG